MRGIILQSIIKGLVVLLSLGKLHCCHALQPNLAKLAPRVYSEKLNYRVAVGPKETPFQLNKLHVELSNNLRTTKKRSTGIHEARILRRPSFINNKGEQIVNLHQGGWEITWSPKSPHGFLACSFVVDEQVQRNEEAKLEAGRFFMYHRVWTQKTLASERERRKKVQAEAATFLKERDEKVKEITDEENNNLGSKVMSYAQAAKSMNNYRTSGYQEVLFIPLYDDQVIELTPDCIVSTRGLIYKIDSSTKSPIQIGESRVDALSEDLGK